MALIKCKECEKDVSDQAGKCPHCGAPVEAKKKGFSVGRVVGALVILLILYAALQNTSEQKDKAEKTATSPASGNKEQSMTASDPTIAEETSVPSEEPDPYDTLSPRAKAIIDKAQKKEKGSGFNIRGLATSMPTLSLYILDTEWKKLSKKEQISLTLYLENMIPDARSNAEDYIGISPSAPIYQQFLSKARNLCDDCWSIMETEKDHSTQRYLVNKTLVQGDDPWSEDDPCCRGEQASVFREAEN